MFYIAPLISDSALYTMINLNQPKYTVGDQGLTKPDHQ